jgi:hypothetical protein
MFVIINVDRVRLFITLPYFSNMFHQCNLRQNDLTAENQALPLLVDIGTLLLRLARINAEFITYFGIFQAVVSKLLNTLVVT